MPIYINKNGQQSGPYEDHIVIDQLRGGMLSPDDLAIRHGDAAWQRLGEMFPGVAAARAEAAVPVFAAGSAGTPAASAVPAAKKGGCLKAGLIGLGLLLVVLGIATAVGGQYIPSTSCDLVEADARKIDKLRSDLEKAKSEFKYDRIGPLQLELNETLAGAEASKRYCDDDKFRNNAISIAGGTVAFIGFLMAVIGLFVGRRK